MKFFYAMAAWIAISAILSVALLRASQGHPVLLVVSMIAFVVAVWRIGCKVH